MALMLVVFNLDDIITLKQAQKKHKSLKVRRKEDINLVYFMDPVWFLTYNIRFKVIGQAV